MDRTRMIAGVALIGGFVVLGLGAFKDTLTPYVGFAEAREMAGRNVQITGVLPAEKRSWYSDDGERTFRFLLLEEDTGDSVEVSFTGVKPATFEEATSIVAVGSFDGSLFRATQVLTKCPSKYEGQDPEQHEKVYGRDDAEGGGGTANQPR